MATQEEASFATEAEGAFSYVSTAETPVAQGLEGAVSESPETPEPDPIYIPSAQELETVRTVSEHWPGLTSGFDPKTNLHFHSRFMERIRAGGFSVLSLRSISMEPLGSLALPHPEDDAPEAVVVVSRHLNRLSGDLVHSLQFFIPKPRR